MTLRLSLGGSRLPLFRKLAQVRWSFVLLLCVLGGVGGVMLYSAGNGNLEPWALRHITRFGIAVCIMLAVAMVDVRFWLRYAYVFYGCSLVLLAAVEVAGTVGMGAQRWIDLGVISLQPSELMKISLILVLARYFHRLSAEEISKPWKLIVPALMVLLPAALVLKQPDLGTASMLLASSATMFFCAGVPWWIFAVVGGAGLAALPVAWGMLHDYQRARVMTFLNPESDPLGTGYHIIQSKIALGSGGVFGRGFMQGSQSQLDFLPEKQTDFIFTMFAEEFGLVGTLALLAVYTLVLAYCFAMTLSARSQFARLVAIGITTVFFLYVFINMAMVMGLVPVVGIPLPLISYGGTAVLSLMFGFGLILSVHVHRDVAISRHSSGDEM
ncbi:MAG: rod shape-determining protein RodA [Rhodospirillales bacterium]|jgi:rod shape determining protein RodA|nr:rod shape-determining protein RodA [Rhodospirillales bacterium]